MNLTDFLIAARKYADLGDSITGQLDAVVLDGEDFAEQNGNALAIAADFLGSLAGQLDENGNEDASGWASEMRDYLANTVTA
jgi:hypothetical protein